MTTSRVTDDRLGFGVIWAVCLTVLVILFGSIPYSASGVGRDEHRTPVPTGVQQLSGTDYLVAPSSTIQASDICIKARYNGDSDEKIKTVRNIGERGVFIKCAASQTWSAKGPISPSYSDALVNTVTSPIWWGAEGLILFVCFIPGLTSLGGDIRRHRNAQKTHEVSLIEQKEILTELWAKDKITDLEYEQKLDKLVRSGV